MATLTTYPAYAVFFSIRTRRDEAGTLVKFCRDSQGDSLLPYQHRQPSNINSQKNVVEKSWCFQSHFWASIFDIHICTDFTCMCRLGLLWFLVGHFTLCAIGLSFLFFFMTFKIICIVYVLLLYRTVLHSIRPDVTVMVDWALKIKYLSLFHGVVFACLARHFWVVFYLYTFIGNCLLVFFCVTLLSMFEGFCCMVCVSSLYLSTCLLQLYPEVTVQSPGR